MDRICRLAALATALLLAGGCLRTEPQPPAATPGDLQAYSLFSATDALTGDWLHFRVTRETDWQLAALDDEVVMKAVGQPEGASSGLARWIRIDPEDCPVIEWSWRVDALQENADLDDRSAEDVAASLFLAFGDPGTMSNPDPVPMLRYAWAGPANPVDAVIASPYLPATLRTVVVRSGTKALGSWVIERRNLLEDYDRAFGGRPEEPIEAFAIFTDNAHLAQPVTAYYRWGRVRCTKLPETGIF